MGLFQTLSYGGHKIAYQLIIIKHLLLSLSYYVVSDHNLVTKDVALLQLNTKGIASKILNTIIFSGLSTVDNVELNRTKV